VLAVEVRQGKCDPELAVEVRERRRRRRRRES